MILPIHGPGCVLIESIITALSNGYNISYQKDEIIEFMSKELVQKLDYTRYMRIPITQEEVNFNLLNVTTSKKYSRLIADMYLPAISSALDIHIRTIKNISGYFAVVNTLPLNTKLGDSKKVITLIIKDGVYQPIVKIPNQEAQNPSPPIKGEETVINLTEEKWKKVNIWKKGKKTITEEVIVISDTDEDITSVKSVPVVIQPKEEVPRNC